MRRFFLKKLGLIIITTFLTPLNFLYASTKKIINKNLTDQQKNIMLKEVLGAKHNWSGIKKFRGDSKFTTYLYRIITYRALDFIKSKGMKYRFKTDSVDNVTINVSSEELNIDNQMTLNNALSILKDKEREIVKLASEGYKHREIADKLNTSTNNISSILSRAYDKMKKYMQEK